jgi:hypothetical protein
MLAPGLFFLAAGIGLLAFQLPDYVRAWKSRAWPKFVAEITSSETSYSTFYGAKTPASIATYSVVSYSYAVSDRVARYGGRLRFGPTSHHEWRKFLENHPPGSKVSVAVHPKNFDNSVLMPGLTALATLYLVIAFAFTLAGIAWLIPSLATAS